MSLLLYGQINNGLMPSNDARCKRDLKDDIQMAIELIFDLREKLEGLHPLAKDIAARLIS